MTEAFVVAEDLHREAILIDAVCPLLDDPSRVAEYVAGGVDIVAPTLATLEGAAVTLRKIGHWHRLLRERDDLILVRTASDIRRAKQQGKTGIIFHFQGPGPVEDSVDLVDAYKALGINIMQLAYNLKNRLGDGCEERTDAGLSRFGLQIVERMNTVGMIVDCSHTGVQTTMDAIEYSTAPVIISHANAKAVHPSPRNVPDELIKAIAANGGTIGVVGFPAFVSADKRPTIDQFIDHIVHIADLVGVEHVTLGIDYYDGQSPYATEADAQEMYESLVACGMWSPAAYPAPPHHYPAGIETPRTMLELTRAMLRRGFQPNDIRKVYGENLLRIYRNVWGE
ncbi:dipeptidase [Mesorhizobium sp. BH1-1-4]|uniref:dipeptidase n=1 Tax=Mesorhizobium sp. BH1-1-4 TaxID=2876662 RepID=UPI001CD09403|nr:dipeptidase [Mesorhizobium sp. BH1-1-4]MBZ9993999.1 dipeptidase [Mesorhizobium sp. BH1-1-4]